MGASDYSKSYSEEEFDSNFWHVNNNPNKEGLLNSNSYSSIDLFEIESENEYIALNDTKPKTENMPGKSDNINLVEKKEIESISSNEISQKLPNQLDHVYNNQNSTIKNEPKFTTQTKKCKTKKLEPPRNKDQEGNFLQKKRKHTKNDSDNIKRKIMVKFLTFLIQLINLIVKDTLQEKYDDNMSFLPFKYEFKKNITSNQLNMLKKQSILHFLTDGKNISNKKNNIDFNNHNYTAFNLIINQNELYMRFFENSCFEYFSLFYKKSDELNLNQYGINQIIDLSKINCFYEDILKEYSNDEEYISRIEKKVKKHFLKKQINFEVKKGN